MEVKRLDWIDMAKGYGILLVMVGHLAEWTPVGSVIYSFHMPLFFLLSGYLFSTRGTFPEFAKKRLKGMLLPYFCLAIPMILWDMFVEKGGLSWLYAPMFSKGKLISIDSYGGTFDWSRVGAQSPTDVLCRDVLGLLIQRRMWTFWFLACLFVLTFLFYALVRFIRWEWLRLLIVAALAAVGFTYYALGGTALPWNVDTCLTALPFYYVGWLLKKYDILEKWLFKNKSYQVRKWGVFLFTISFFLNVMFCSMNWAISGTGLEMYYNRYGFLPVMFLAAFIGCFATIVLSGIYKLRTVKYIGEHSLIYFLLHQGIFLPLFEKMLQKLHFLQGDSGREFWLRVVVIVLLSCASLTLIDWGLRKTPLKVVLGK